MQPQPQIVTGGQDRVHVRGKVGQQPGELSERPWRIQLMQIINNQRDVAVSVGEFREHPVGHRRCVEVGCRCWRFRAAGRGRSVTDRVEQGQPELLGVLLAALHLHEGEPVRLARSSGPGAQQRRLPAAGRRRDDRHLARRRAIQGSDKITPVDQPGSCWSHRHRPALISTPDTLAPVTQSWHLLSRYQASAPTVNGGRTPVLPHCHPRAAANPSRLVNHRDPVTASHLTGGEPGPVAKAGTADRGRAPRFQGDTVTSPATGADGAADLPDYAPIPRSALGPVLNDQRYYVGRVERNLYWVTDGVYNSAFLTTADGVVVFDAPPSIGGNLRRAVDEIAAANGVPNTVTHLVYSHHHADHAGAASLFDGDVVRIGHEETKRLLLRDGDPARPAPEITFADTYTLQVGGERVELAWHGPNHSPDNIYIHFPGHDTLMFIDVVNAGWVPIYNLNLSEDVIGYMAAPATALSYPWTHFICGHLGRLATREDVAVHQHYIADIEASAREALTTVNPVPYYMRYGENAWAGVKAHLDTVTERAAAPVIAKYTGVLAAADIEDINTTTTFAIMQSMRLDSGPSGPVHP